MNTWLHKRRPELVISVICIFLFLSLWIKMEFGSPSFDALIYHLLVGSVTKGDLRFVVTFVVIVVCIPLLVYSLLSKFERASRLLKRIHPGFIYALLIVSFYVLVESTNLIDFVQAYFSDDFAEQIYQKPGEYKNGTGKNLVIIYAESIENSYMDESLFGKNLIQPLSDFSDRFVSFENIVQLAGGGWTIAAIVNTQCGIPLKAPLFIPDQNKRGNSFVNFFPDFLPGAQCLGDILNTLGYYQVFMNGSELAFAGVGSFFDSHGYDEVIGYNHWVEKLGKEVPYHSWGLPDDLLLNQAKEKFLELHNRDKPFSLTVLTVDTHHPNGMASPTCDKLGYTRLEDRIVCAATLIKEFIDFVITHDADNKTSIFVIGDHLAMKNNLYDALLKKNRNIYGAARIPGEKSCRISEPMAQIDFFPTFLYSLGITNRCKLGLGSLLEPFGDCPKRSENEFEMVKKAMHGHSRFLNSLW